MMVAICRRLKLLSRRLNFWKIAFLQSQPSKIAKPQSRPLKIHQKSLPTVPPERLSHFPRQKKRHPPLFSERRMPQKWLNHGLFRPFFILFSLAEPRSRRGSRGQNECHLNLPVLGNISTAFLELSVDGNISTNRTRLRKGHSY